MASNSFGLGLRADVEVCSGQEEIWTSSNVLELYFKESLQYMWFPQDMQIINSSNSNPKICRFGFGGKLQY